MKCCHRAQSELTIAENNLRGAIRRANNNQNLRNFTAVNKMKAAREYAMRRLVDHRCELAYA